jgi:hypothetical protein
MRRIAVVAAMAVMWAGSAAAASSAGLAAAACAALAQRVAALPGAGPVFLRSYDGPDGQGPNPEPVLHESAFTYDNALAVIALVACGKPEPARRVGEALLAAALHDRAGAAGRLRNAYRAGPAEDRPVPPMGWWDKAAGSWVEDAYQVGTATGNVAWAALALLTLFEATGDRRFGDGAATLARWAADKTADARGAGGYIGGLHADGDAERPQTWKSTEHNTDLEAVFVWLDRIGWAGGWRAEAMRARGFLDAMWNEGGGHFPIGTGADGMTVNRASSGLDAQLWPLLLRDSPSAWRASLAFVEREHGVGSGFDFNEDRDGVWFEGTAQAALTYRAVGAPEKAEASLALIAGQISPGGYVWATDKPRLTTGLAVGPDSAGNDFFYFRIPHLGATAWAALAAAGWNPLTGERVE